MPTGSRKHAVHINNTLPQQSIPEIETIQHKGNKDGGTQCKEISKLPAEKLEGNFKAIRQRHFKNLCPEESSIG